ncbi:ABC-2 type transporter family protein [Striga asiatica]|uniref:ABC-2 type transporter family protein n=1 Tax=Striga asiatica TaxID=4170 RepID=A0A5A7QNL1_STRAF|nr:ABC-2 type transporter family protein [Striga asiatica]
MAICIKDSSHQARSIFASPTVKENLTYDTNPQDCTKSIAIPCAGVTRVAYVPDCGEVRGRQLRWRAASGRLIEQRRMCGGDAARGDRGFRGEEVSGGPKLVQRIGFDEIHFPLSA